MCVAVRGGKRIIPLIFASIAIALVGFLLYSYLIRLLTPEENGVTCSVDEDCVASECCHPSECVHVSQQPDCKTVFCSMDCQEGTMDCGQGKCGCVNGKCEVIRA